jgi:type I restriction enzyme R subunit
MSATKENELEAVALSWFAELGYEVHDEEYAPGELGQERQSFEEVVLRGRLESALHAINRDVPPAAIDEAIRRVLRQDHPTLIGNNQAFHRLLVDGVAVEAQVGGKARGFQVRLIDFEDVEANDFLVVRQFTVVDGARGTGQVRRLDLVVFVNGLPLGVLELKNPSDPEADVWKAYAQIQTYKQDLPTLFAYNAVVVGSDDVEARIGSLTAPRSRFAYWRTVDGERLAPGSSQPLEVLITGVFHKERFTDLIRHFVFFEGSGSKVSKILGGYHQFHAVRVAVEKTRTAIGEKGDRRVGVVWHTQGSGKSYSMLFYAGKLVTDSVLKNPTLVVLTDRNDLDLQLFQTFSHGEKLLHQSPIQARDREHLRELLRTTSGGVYFTTIQKFAPEGETFDALSDRRNIVVIADEAHRSQYGFGGRVDRKTGQKRYGFAKHLRDALPNASFIGFTGTPVELEDKDTRKVFGDEIDVYDIQQAVADGATVPIYYEARLAKLDLDEAYKPKIDPEFEEITEQQEEGAKESLKTEWTALERIVGHPKRLEIVAKDLVEHFEKRLDALDGKAMVVCMSRRICAELYAEIRKLRPHWHDDDVEHGVMKVVMTGSASDAELLQPHVRSKRDQELVARRFKDEKDPLKLVFVRDMWLTGFDAPCMHTLYVDKPMQGHNLMQAIARVNRVFGDKPGGLVVDYLGILGFLKSAMATYTKSGGRGDPTSMMEKAVEVLDEKLDLLRDLFHGFDYERFFTGSPKERLALLPAAREHVLSLREEPPAKGAPAPNDREKDGYDRFLLLVTEASKAFALAAPHTRTDEVRDELAFFQAVKAGLVKLATSGKKASADDLDHALRQIVSNAVISEGVIDIFAAAGIERPDLSILSDEFLVEVQGMKNKRLAVELLHRLLNGEVKERFAGSVVGQKSFADLLEKAMVRYRNRSLDSAAMIQELIDLAKAIREAAAKGKELGLSREEFFFYEALAENESAREVMGDKILSFLAHELLELVRKEATVDWTLRKNVQANLRALVKRLLRKHGYPPDLEKAAVETVLAQAKQLGIRLVDGAPEVQDDATWTDEVGVVEVEGELPYPIAVADAITSSQESLALVVKSRWEGIERAIAFLVLCEIALLRRRGSTALTEALEGAGKPLALGSWLELAWRLAALFDRDDAHPIARAARAFVNEKGKPSELASEVQSRVVPLRNTFAHHSVPEAELAEQERPVREAWEKVRAALAPLAELELISRQSIEDLEKGGAFRVRVRRHQGIKTPFAIVETTANAHLPKDWCALRDRAGHVLPLEGLVVSRYAKGLSRHEVMLARGVWPAGEKATFAAIQSTDTEKLLVP